MSHDYLREIDLNPNINGAPAPINSPLDPRAMHYFGFLANGQEVTVPMQTAGGGPFRADVSFHYGNQPTATAPQPQPAIDAVLDPFGAPFPVVRYEENHDRRHLLVWLDPSYTPVPQGPCIVRVRAWARE